MVRDTSLAAYHAIVDSGVLGAERTRAYKILFGKGPMPQFQLAAFEGKKCYGGTLSKRISELTDMGLVYDTGKRETNPHSGYKCIVWDVTSKMPPSSPYRRVTKTKRLEEEIDRLRGIIADCSRCSVEGLM